MLWHLPKGTALPVIGRRGDWVKFDSLGTGTFKLDIKGWISKNYLTEGKSTKSWIDTKIDVRYPYVSQTTVAAAIRSFALRYGKTSRASVDSLIDIDNNIFTVDEYLQFQKEVGGMQEDIIDTSYSFLLKEYCPSLEEKGIGLGVASRIARQGLVANILLFKYVNMIGTMLASHSGAYDYYFPIYIMQDDQYNALSLPGGYIFVSKGLLKLCTDESELAAVIAHELIHVILKHGMKEIKERDISIQADELFQELNEETGAGNDSLTAELEEYASEAYENIMKPRLQSYEEEADRGAALLLTRAGYDPHAVARMVMRIRDSIKDSENLDRYNPFLMYDFQKRYNRLMDLINKKLPNVKGVTNGERFMKRIGR
jgi:hypothetical protein